MRDVTDASCGHSWLNPPLATGGLEGDIYKVCPNIVTPCPHPSNHMRPIAYYHVVHAGTYPGPRLTSQLALLSHHIVSICEPP